MTSHTIRQSAVSVTAQVVRLTSAALAAMLLLMAVVHLIRHLLVEVPQPPTSIGWLASLLLVGLSSALRCAWRKVGSTSQEADTKVLWLACSVAALVWSSSLTVLASGPWDAAAIWFIALAGEIFWWSLLLCRSSGVSSSRPVRGRASRSLRALISTLAEPDRPQLGAELDESVVQQLTRSESEEHGELIHGLVRCRFCTGERRQIQHVAFCPPLDAQPSILVDQIAGPAAKVKVAQAESFGARFEIRLDRACRRPSDFVFEFFADTVDDAERVDAA